MKAKIYAVTTPNLTILPAIWFDVLPVFKLKHNHHVMPKRNVLKVYLSINSGMPYKSVKYCWVSVFVLFITTTGMAQLCTGSLGDPVVNITFGSGANPGPPLPAATTNYSFTSSGCPNDGSYTVVNSTADCFGNTWHTLTQDHTPGDANGYFMLVNAAALPGVFYLDTLKNLCSSTTYEFSAWILSILKSSACNGNGNRPNITFSIETTTGTLIQNYNTADILNLSAPQWNQYGFFFTLPPAVSEVVLRMVNNAPGNCGNDLALDDITFRPCGPKVDAAFINVNGVNGKVNFCISDNRNITLNGAAQAGYTNPAFQWQQSLDNGLTWIDIPGATSNNYSKTFSAFGTFQYRMTASEAGNIGIARCRVASNVLTIVIDSIPVPGAGSTSPVCAGGTVTLNSKGGAQYAWMGPNGFAAVVASPVINTTTLANSGKYYVQVTTPGGCINRDSTIVSVNPLPIADAGVSDAVCEGNTVTLQATGGATYSWLPVTGLSNAAVAGPVASPAVTTLYTVTVTSVVNCQAADTVRITVLKKPVADAGADKKMVEGQTVSLSGITGGDVSNYFWTPPIYINDPSSLTPIVSPPADQLYTLHVASGNGCGTATDDVFVRVFKKIIVPNAFSPNDDAINDKWIIDGLDTYPESVTEVYNRWGQMVFRSKGYSVAWNGTYNGKPLPVGTYYYIIDRKNNFELMKGWVLIVR
jgi:gliding motility-associated-like protein